MSHEPQLDRFLRLAERVVGLQSVRTVVEVGARDCVETAELSRRLPRAQIIAFECNPATLETCRRRVALLDNATLVEAAVTDTAGPVTFHPIDPARTATDWPDGNPGASSLLRASGQYAAEQYVQTEITVQGVRLDDVLSERRVEHVDLLWMDIQGAELLALRGLGSRLADVRLIHLETEFMEIYREQPLLPEIHAFLARNGFDLVAFTHLGRYAGDAVFARRDLVRGRLRLHRAALRVVAPLTRLLPRLPSRGRP